MAVIELEQILSPDVYQKLEAAADRQQTALSDLVREAIEDYLQFLEEETSDGEIEAGFLQGWHETMTGQTRPARDVLDEIRKARQDDSSS